MKTRTRRVRTAREQRNRKKAKQNTARGFGPSSHRTGPLPSQASYQVAGLGDTVEYSRGMGQQ